MKKITALITAAVLSLVLIAAAGIKFSAAAEDLFFAADVSCGEAQDAAGLSVRLLVQSEGYLYWSALYDAGTDTASEIVFDYARNGESTVASYTSQEEETRLTLEVAASVGSSYQGNFTLEDLMYELPWEIVSEAEQMTEAGKKSTLVANLDDYYTYFPLSVFMTYDEETQEEETVWLYGDEEEEYEFLNAYFQIPVPEGFEVKIEIEKDDEGNVIAVGVEKTGTDAMPESVYADAGTCGYIAFAGGEEDLDYSQLEGGFGIYKISYEISGLYEDAGEFARDISITGIEPLASLSGTGLEVRSLVYSEDREELFVLGQKEGDLTVLILDAQTGALLGETVVAENVGSEEIVGSWEIENGMVLGVSSGLIVFAAQEQTGEVSSLYIPLEEETLFSSIDCAEQMSFLYSEGRLAYAYTSMDDSNTDFYLMIFDSAGVVYHSCVSCSIDTGFGGVYTGESAVLSLSLSGSL